MKLTRILFGLLLVGSTWVTDVLANPFRGFLITKSGDQITGFIGGIQSSGRSNQVVFINDFGTFYMIDARQIKGFAFLENKQLRVFESVRNQGRWHFLRMIYSGQEARLYRLPPLSSSLTLWASPTAQARQNQDPGPARFFLKLKGKSIRRVTPWRFAHKARKWLQPIVPELAEKIGQTGYQFRDLEKIVKELDTLLKRDRAVI